MTHSQNQDREAAAIDSAPSFAELGLSPTIVSAVEARGYSEPSPIQQQAIPAILAGNDVMAAAQTGTGKTAGFTLPLLQRLSQGRRAGGNQVRALILTPTRELAAQVEASVAHYSQNSGLRHAVAFGGVKINPQMMRLRSGVDVLVATPGRLLDLHSQNAVSFSRLEILVLDEADRMLDMGFVRDIKKILALLPERRQNLLFSATFSDDIRNLAKGLVKQAVEISVTPPNSTVDSVEQSLFPCDKSRKAALLTTLIDDGNWEQVLVFTRTKHGANRLTRHLEAKGIQAAAIHGNKSQGARTRALAHFKAGDIRVLVATDIAARGLDIHQLPHVVNYDLPNVAEDYVHRIGRTGRAGASGHAVSLVCADEFDQLKAIERLIQKVIPRQTQEGFEPQAKLPESPTHFKPLKPRKPKKKKAASPEAAKTDTQTEKKPRRKPQQARGHARNSTSPDKPRQPRRRRRSNGNKNSNNGSASSRQSA